MTFTVSSPSCSFYGFGNWRGRKRLVHGHTENGRKAGIRTESADLHFTVPFTSPFYYSHNPRVLGCFLNSESAPYLNYLPLALGCALYVLYGMNHAPLAIIMTVSFWGREVGNPVWPAVLCGKGQGKRPQTNFTIWYCFQALGNPVDEKSKQMLHIHGDILVGLTLFVV